jgi:hypothetical protein
MLVFDPLLVLALGLLHGDFLVGSDEFSQCLPQCLGLSEQWTALVVPYVVLVLDRALELVVVLALILALVLESQSNFVEIGTVILPVVLAEIEVTPGIELP